MSIPASEKMSASTAGLAIHATIVSENHQGVGAVAAPIFNAAGELAGAVGAVMPAERYWTDGLWEKFKSETRNTAESISFAIGYPLPE